jgi:hypothetical protein
LQEEAHSPRPCHRRVPPASCLLSCSLRAIQTHSPPGSVTAAIGTRRGCECAMQACGAPVGRSCEQQTEAMSKGPEREQGCHGRVAHRSCPNASTACRVVQTGVLRHEAQQVRLRPKLASMVGACVSALAWCQPTHPHTPFHHPPFHHRRGHHRAHHLTCEATSSWPCAAAARCDRA